MRLTKIKLAGFKSFVDPTTIPLPSNLVGIVGPNGCGKSNIIDAVRWVMGESSARNLRGGAMVDVIFNGSASRKPVGQASVEMVFDNSAGRVGGPYGHYNEISVKRVLGRDGQSHYHLNGSKCRRSDISDLFSGTGLGPRSYSIIEQGMISRLIEARPEELRVFLEQAAGISKYKERRRETENRMRHTRENLERLNDLRSELARQIEHLQQQAKTAEHYRALKEQQRHVTGQWHMHHWCRLDEECRTLEARVTKGEAEVEAVIAAQRGIENDRVALHTAFNENSALINKVQGDFYACGADIVAIEQSLGHIATRTKQRQQLLASLQRDEQSLLAHLEGDQQKIAALAGDLTDSVAQQAEQTRLSTTSTARLATAETALRDWQSEWDQLNQRILEPEKQAASAEMQRRQQSSLIAKYKARLQQLQEALSAIDVEKRVAALTAQEPLEKVQVQQLAKLGKQCDELQSHIQQQRTLNLNMANQLNSQRNKIQQLSGQKASLEVLQHAALGGEQHPTTQWLSDSGVKNVQRLAQVISVTPGWERAVELVLGFYLESVCVDELDSLASSLNSAVPENLSLTLFDTTAQHRKSESNKPRLLDQIVADCSLQGLLGEVYIADDLTQALSQRDQLAPHESLITQDGFWLGASWLRVGSAADNSVGPLQRESQLRELISTLQPLEQQCVALEKRAQEAQQQLNRLEAKRQSKQCEYNEAHHALAETGKQLNSAQVELVQCRDRQQQITQQQQQQVEELARVAEEQQQAAQQYHDAGQLIEQLNQQRKRLSSRRESLQTERDEAEQQQHAIHLVNHDLALKIQSIRATKEAIEQGIARSQQQLEQLATRRNEQNSEQQQQQSPAALNTSLDEKRALHKAIEAELAELRTRAGEIEAEQHNKNSQRAKIEKKTNKKRNNLEVLRLKLQVLLERRQGLLEKINETGFAFPQLFDEVTEQSDEAQLKQQLVTIEQQLQQLGPINLAAINEYERESERQRYLQEQHQDLVEALTTLESAITKIDRETRTRFKETFDKVNAGLQASFPVLFDGGHAYLDLTGDDLLNTGVTVMARPPGKRNSSIHLLSGGEKALTAVALVFAIFELNPAPFCLLDEVDAPLDETNVGRFCKMVESMSERVQFIFISHNKITMEMAQQLNGVTMSEPGVSRLVTVDIKEAYDLAAQ
ncbi:MAG: chromosome segregation protein SMC [Gammaproteobacteria bacterium]|nr:chromosome segregation protein SMC [Gammaproteobacteria bacterium]MCF6230841.1 chromosome segregation protein SMC [Gammaproteobacteria bacterium]